MGSGRVLFCCALLACTSSEKADTAVSSEWNAECSVLEEAPLDSADILSRCPLGTDNGSFFFGDQQSWDDWLESCYGEVDAPDINFDTHDVLGSVVELACPFSGAPALLGTESCGEEARSALWTFSDHCYCDYFGSYLALYALEKGRYTSFSIDLIQEATCEETICACEDGTTENACELTQFCPVTDSYTGDVDGLPPEWP